MSTIEVAIRLAVEAHAGQVDKAGRPYILHPLRLMQKCPTEDLQIVAVLHDVLEDTQVTEAELQKLGFPDHIISALKSLTKVHGEAYSDFISRAMQDSLAIVVKELDLIDNMDCTRLPEFTDADAARMKKYTSALFQIRQGISFSPKKI